MKCIPITDKQRNQRNGCYLFTYAYQEPQLFKELFFPLSLSRTDAETILHTLQRLAQEHEEINCLLRERIDEDEWLQHESYASNRIPLLPLVVSLAGKHNVFSIEWGGDEMDITKLPSGLQVSDHDVRFFFPYDHFFTRFFIDTVGESMFDDEPVHVSSFLHEWSYLGRSDIASILDPYKTVFIDEKVLPMVLQKLRSLCNRAERFLVQKSFCGT